jgi:hypothetical protein
VTVSGRRAALANWRLPGLGHLLSRNLAPQAQEQGPFDPDPAASVAARSAEDDFLAQLGYTK